MNLQLKLVCAVRRPFHPIHCDGMKGILGSAVQAPREMSQYGRCLISADTHQAFVAVNESACHINWLYRSLRRGLSRLAYEAGAFACKL